MLTKHLTALSGYDVSCSFDADGIAEKGGPDAAIAFLEEKLSLFRHVPGDPLIHILENLGVRYFNRYEDRRLYRQAQQCLQRVLRSQPIPDRESDHKEVIEFAAKNLAVMEHFVLDHFDHLPAHANQSEQSVQERQDELNALKLEQKANAVRENDRVLMGTYRMMYGGVRSLMAHDRDSVIRDILEAVYLFPNAEICGKDGVRSPEECLTYFTDTFKLGWVAVKGIDAIKNLEEYDFDAKIGGFGGQYTSEQLKYCLKSFAVCDETILNNAAFAFLTSNPPVWEKVKHISDLLLHDGRFSDDSIHSTLKVVFVIGFIAAKCPEKLPSYFSLRAGPWSSTDFWETAPSAQAKPPGLMVTPTAPPIVSAQSVGGRNRVEGDLQRTAVPGEQANLAQSANNSLRKVTDKAVSSPLQIPTASTLPWGDFMGIDIGSCFNFGIEKFKKNMAFYVVGFLVIVGISIGINIVAQVLSFGWGFAVGLIGSKIHLGEMAIKFIAAASGYIIGALVGILIAPFMVGYYRGIKKEYEGGIAEISDVFSAFDISLPCLMNYAVANLIIIAGVICCIIPGILLSPLMNLSIFFLAKGEVLGLNALKLSWETLKKNPILILWNIVLGLFAALGLLVCCV
ncbi:MAG: hypothetical protein NT118_16965, partial [Lentisphaerae bacterium]|nr:hypothetical protein [Lentisphaerota bacterium]